MDDHPEGKAVVNDGGRERCVGQQKCHSIVGCSGFVAGWHSALAEANLMAN